MMRKLTTWSDGRSYSKACWWLGMSRSWCDRAITPTRASKPRKAYEGRRRISELEWAQIRKGLNSERF